jgi:hypothetical protein
MSERRIQRQHGHQESAPGHRIEDPEGPLFQSAASAAAFALNFSGQNYQKPLTSRMAQPASARGRGLSGLDGAAQAGMIRAELAAIGLTGEAIIIAEMTNKTKPCTCKAPCCSGELTNWEWAAAIGLLSNIAKDMKICPGYANVRANLLKRFFGVPLEITEIARLCGVTRDTVYNHNAKLFSVFKPLKKKAWSDFDARLVESSLISNQKVP